MANLPSELVYVVFDQLNLLYLLQTSCDVFIAFGLLLEIHIFGVERFLLLEQQLRIILHHYLLVIVVDFGVTFGS